MKIFITGATGYIGFSVAAAFRRAGHHVWGMTRSKEKAAWLARQEIRPVIGNMQNPDSYTAVTPQFDVLIHVAVDYRKDTAHLDALTMQSLINNAQPGATLIYTSGTWVHGPTNGKAVDETAVPNPIAAVAWRPTVEQMTLNAARLNGIVIRPGVVYGKSGGMTGDWFASAVSGDELTIVGDGRNHWAMIHVDDLALGYVYAAKSGLKGEAFNLVGSASTVTEMVEAVGTAVPAAKAPRYLSQSEAAQTMGAMAEALALNQQIDTRKARERLAWQPRHPNFADDVETYLAAWQAWQN